MALIPFDDLIAPISEDEARESLLNVATALGLPATSWQDGGVARTMLAVMARTLSTLQTINAEARKGGLVGLAYGDWLTDLAQRNYNVFRNPATRASGVVNLVNSTPNAISVAAGELVVSNPLTGKTYTSTQAYASTGNDSVPVTFAADGLGPSYTSQAGQVSQVVTSLIGVTCTNPLALIGADAETDAALVERIAISFAPLSPLGAKDVYRAVLTDSVKTPTVDPINRVIVYPNYATGHVTVVVAGTGGALSAPDLVIAQSSVETWCEPQGIVADVVNASPQIISMVLTVKVRGDSRTDAQIQSSVTSAAGAFVNALPIGGEIIAPDVFGRLDLTGLTAAMFATSATVRDIEFASSASDIAMMPYSVAQLGVVTVSVVRL